jgi:hypothetical protein
VFLVDRLILVTSVLLLLGIASSELSSRLRAHRIRGGRVEQLGLAIVLPQSETDADPAAD